MRNIATTKNIYGGNDCFIEKFYEKSRNKTSALMRTYENMWV